MSDITFVKFNKKKTLCGIIIVELILTMGSMHKNKHSLLLYICLFLSNRVHVFLPITNMYK
jgi:hypothetical protein